MGSRLKHSALIGKVYMDSMMLVVVRNVSEVVDAFGKETLTENWQRNALKYQLFVWIGCVRNSVGENLTC